MVTTYTPSLGQYYMSISASKYDRPQPFGKVEWKTEKIFRLPLPSELRDDTGVSYSNIDLKSVGDVINNDLASGAVGAGLRFSGDLISKSAGAVTRSLVGAIPSSGTVGSAIGAAVTDAGAALFPAEQITSAIQQATGLAPNPNPSVAFQGPQLREFSFSWTFFPRTRAESDKVQLIVKTLKQIALPENAVSNSGAILKYPWIVKLNFFPWDDLSKHEYGWTSQSIVRYKKCFMSSVNVNYNPSNVPAFFRGEGGKAGMPVAVQLTISFKEIEYFLSKDYGGGAGEDLLDVLGKAGSDIARGVGEFFGADALGEALAQGTGTPEASPNVSPQDTPLNAQP